MSHTLLVRMRKAEGALVRLLGQIGRRGYDVLSLSVRLTPDRTSFDVVVEFEPYMPVPPAPPLPRPPEILPLLVSKLCEVEKVELRLQPDPRPGAAEPPGNGSPQEHRPKSAAEQRTANSE
jgi:acetolactate synthase regulatory subunit